MGVNERIKQARKTASLSQRKLAAKLDTSFMTIRRWESGQTSPRLEELEKISNVLNVPIEYLTGFPQEQKNSNVQDSCTECELPNMSYWGGVADNARNVAEYGNEADKADVCQMLKRALAFFTPATGAKSVVDIHHNEMNKTLIVSK